ncbi:MAG: DUF2213 domain-containing protein [Myxococcaceae bacterium]|nr:MAG: DUF2213 domain-containing protein [Myxococcaceae bacterium]
MIKLNLYDRLSFDAAHMSKKAGGYLAAAPRVSRTGIQLYLGKEIGGELADKDVVRVYRPESEVFHKDAMASLAHRPLTNDHPKVEVTSENWSEYAVGQSDGDVLRDQEYVRVPMLFMDSSAVKAIEAGKRQLSVGYSCDIEVASGTTPTGEAYDAIQRNIRANHIALVKAARGGARLSVGDELPFGVEDAEPEPPPTRRDQMNLRTMTVDGITCEMTDTTIQVVQRALDNAANQVKALEATHKSVSDSLNKQVTDMTAQVTTLSKDKDTLTAENATLKSQLDSAKLTPQQLDQLVADRTICMGKAAAILGDKLVVDGKTDGEIRRQVVDHALKDVAKGWTDEQVATSFATLTASVKAVDTNRAVDVARAAFTGGSQPVLGDRAAAEKSYSDYNNRMQNAWKTPQGTA